MNLSEDDIRRIIREEISRAFADRTIAQPLPGAAMYWDPRYTAAQPTYPGGSYPAWSYAGAGDPPYGGRGSQ